jgi:hypothetical protein
MFSERLVVTCTPALAIGCTSLTVRFSTVPVVDPRIDPRLNVGSFARRAQGALLLVNVVRIVCA